MIDLDLSNPVNQVRVLIGDLTGEYITDENIQFVLTQNNDDVLLTAIACLDYIISVVSFYVREEVGDVKVMWDQLYNQLSQRKADLDKEAVYKKASMLFYFGGTVKADVQKNKDSVNYVNPTEKDFMNILDKFEIDPRNPYLIK